MYFKYLYFIVAFFLFMCLAHMPYGYYNFVRFLCMTFFSVLFYRFIQEKQVLLSFVSFSIVLLFQPFIKFHLGRTIWNVVDVIIGLLLIALFLYERKK